MERWLISKACHRQSTTTRVNFIHLSVCNHVPTWNMGLIKAQLKVPSLWFVDEDVQRKAFQTELDCHKSKKLEKSAPLPLLWCSCQGKAPCASKKEWDMGAKRTVPCLSWTDFFLESLLGNLLKRLVFRSLKLYMVYDTDKNKVSFYV